MNVYMNHKLAFIHIPKTAGMSITNFLGRQLKYHHVGNDKLHTTLNELPQDEIDRLTFFFVLRNPFERVLSYFMWLYQPAENEDKCKLFNEFNRWTKTHFKDQEESYEDFLTRNGKWILPEDTHVIDFNNLIEDLDTLFNKVLELNLNMDEFPHHHKTKHGYWIDYYDEDSYKIILKKERWFFERFDWRLLENRNRFLINGKYANVVE
jgi:hypothetical protein